MTGDLFTGAGETEVIVVACDTDFRTFGVRLPSLIEISPFGVPADVLLGPVLLFLPERFTIFPRIRTISAASSKLSSSMPS